MLLGVSLLVRRAPAKHNSFILDTAPLVTAQEKILQAKKRGGQILADQALDKNDKPSAVLDDDMMLSRGWEGGRHQFQVLQS